MYFDIMDPAEQCETARYDGNGTCCDHQMYAITDSYFLLLRTCWEGTEPFADLSMKLICNPNSAQSAEEGRR